MKADLAHGTRARYQQAGCGCTPCRAANAAYQASIRRLRLEGKRPLGSKVDARPMWRQIRSLKIEGLSYMEIARRLGFRRLHLCTDTVTLRNYLKVRKLYQRLMLDGTEPAA